MGFQVALRGKAATAWLPANRNSLVDCSDRAARHRSAARWVSSGADPRSLGDPIEGYTWFENHYPAERYFDLFSRYRHNERWHPHGNEAPDGYNAVDIWPRATRPAATPSAPASLMVGQVGHEADFRLSLLTHSLTHLMHY
jgi:hypothetical protein